MRWARQISWLLVGLAMALGAAACVAAPPPTAPTRAGAVIFLVSRPGTILPITVAGLRDLVQRRTDAVLASTGRDVVASRDLVVSAGAARVRSGLALSEAFLADVRGEPAVGELFVVHVVVAANRLYVLARSLDTGTGSVGGVWLDEQVLDPVLRGVEPEAEAATLRRALEIGLAAIARTAPAPPPLVAPLMVLPVAAVGCAADEALAFTHAVLYHLRTEVGAAVIDPGLLLGLLHASGEDPTRLDADGRALLAAHFCVATLTRGALVGYDDTHRSASRASLIDEEILVSEPVSTRNYSFTLTAIDLGDGLVKGAADVHHRAPDSLGLFGRQREFTPLADIRAVATTAWTILSTARGDS